MKDRIRLYALGLPLGLSLILAALLVGFGGFVLAHSILGLSTQLVELVVGEYEYAPGGFMGLAERPATELAIGLPVGFLAIVVGYVFAALVLPLLDQVENTGARRRQHRRMIEASLRLARWRRTIRPHRERFWERQRRRAVKDQAYKRSGGRCECTRQHPGATNASHHGGRCPKIFVRHGAWEAHHRVAVSSGGDDSLSNCEVLCLTCHELTATYGG